MKQLKCPDCDASVATMYAGETAEAIMQQLLPHYQEVHAEVMQDATPEKQQAWMASFKADFDAAPTLPEKTITCYETGCTASFTNADQNALLNDIYAHYMDVHPTVIPSATAEQKKAWMERFETEWETA